MHDQTDDIFRTVLRCVRDIAKAWSWWKLVYFILALAEMMVFVPFQAHEFLKNVENATWYDNHEKLGVGVIVHMNFAMILALLTLGILKYNNNVQTAAAIIARLFGIILLQIVIYSTDAAPWEKGMNWFAIGFAGQSILLGFLTLVMPKGEEASSATVTTLLFKTWLPALIITALSTGIIYLYPTSAFTNAFAAGQMLYTLGMNVLLCSTYFITAYDKFNQCEDLRKNPENNREDELLSGEEAV